MNLVLVCTWETGRFKRQRAVDAAGFTKQWIPVGAAAGPREAAGQRRLKFFRVRTTGDSNELRPIKTPRL